MTKLKITLGVLLLATILALSFGTGYALAVKNSTGVQGLDVVTQAWNIIFTNYVEKDRLNPARLSQGAIKGIIKELDDPYTDYLSPETYQFSMSSLEGKVGGIGAQVSLRDKQIVIIAPVAGSPAERAGIRPGDVILKVNGSSTADMTLAEAVMLIRGPKGTSVRITIQHQGETEPVELEIVREEIQLTSVRYEMKGDIAYIDISHFSDPTDTELSAALESVIQQGATGIVLDLRANPGGLLETVIDVASHFIREGVVTSVRDRAGNLSTRQVKAVTPVTDLPMVVLVDSYSASGSEVLSGALQDYSRAVIAGTKTFGKGSVNTIHRLADGGGLMVTIARWLTPKGRLIEGIGLQPDKELKLTGEDAINWAIDYLHGTR